MDAPFEAVVADVEVALADAGFGVLCDGDVGDTVERELGEDFRDYRILGACIPALAAEALEVEPTLGALLPCNVAIYAGNDDVVVAAVDPERLLGISDNGFLDPIAADVKSRFENVLETVSR